MCVFLVISCFILFLPQTGGVGGLRRDGCRDLVVGIDPKGETFRQSRQV